MLFIYFGLLKSIKVSKNGTKVHYPLSHAYFFYKDRYTFSTDSYDNPLQDYPYLKKKNIGCPLQIAISLG